MCDDDLDAILTVISTKINKIFCDREFVGCVREDLDVVLKNDKHCVLFPKLKPVFLKVLRYQAFIFDLSVFCIGSGPNQVAVVCKKVTKEPTDDCQSVSAQKVSKKMEPEENTSKSGTKKSKLRPTQSYYVPPAQRSSLKKSKTKEKARKDLKQTSGNTKRSNKVLEADGNENAHLNEAYEDVNVVCSECVDSSLAENERAKYTHSSICATLNDESLVVQNLDIIEFDLDSKPKADHGPSRHDVADEKNSTVKDSPNECLEVSNCTENTLAEASLIENVEDNVILPLEEFHSEVRDEIVPKELEIQANFSDLYISYEDDDDELLKKSVDCDTDNEKEEMKRALENINRKRRPLIKNMHNDDTLWISDNTFAHKTNHPENEKNNVGKDSMRTNNREHNNLANWEDMFDDSGELHAEYVGEIVRQIGCEVKVVKASHDYGAYRNAKYQDLEHVIELYDFPSSFKTQDIMQLYRTVSTNPMYVKWCDDTHCLLVLSSPAQAQRALQMEHDIIKSRPLGLASSIAATTASGSDLKPAMKRPPTNMQTARRLINTHLGTKSTLSKEEVEQERRALRDAREQRRLERQNEKDAWEGRPRSTKS